MATQQDIAAEQARRFKIQQSWQSQADMGDWFATHINDPFTRDVIQQGIYQPAIRSSNIGATNANGEAYGTATEGNITSPIVVAKLNTNGNVVWGNSNLSVDNILANRTKYWDAVKTDINNTIVSQTAASQATANSLAQAKAASEKLAEDTKIADFVSANPDYIELLKQANANRPEVIDSLIRNDVLNIAAGNGSIASNSDIYNQQIQQQAEAKAQADAYNAQVAKQDAAEAARLQSIKESTAAREAQAVKDKADGEAAISKYVPIISQAMGQGKFYNDSQLEDLLDGIRNGSQPWQSLQTMAETAQQWVAQNSKVPATNTLDTGTKITDTSINNLTNGAVGTSQIGALGTSQPNTLSTSSAGALGTSQIGALSTTQLATLDSAVKNGFYSAQQVADIKTAVNNGTMGNAQLGGILKTAADKNATVVTDKIGTQGALTTGGTSALTTGSTSALSTGGTSALTTGGTSALSTGGTSALTTGGTSALATGSIPALTTADLASWTSSLPQGLNSQQLTDALKTQQDTLSKSYAEALTGNQTALSSQNAEFLKNWNTSADALKTSILSGVDTKNKAFGTQATQGFMDAFKNFQIPTNQQTGVNMGNYNDNRNAAADQWWSQYVTGRR